MLSLVSAVTASSTLQSLCLHRLLPTLIDLSSLPLLSDSAQLALELFPSVDDAIAAFSVSDHALSICEGASHHLFFEIVQEGPDAPLLADFSSLLVPAFKQFLQSNPTNVPCLFPQLPASLQSHYAQIFQTPSSVFHLDEPVQEMTEVLETFGFRVVGRLDLSDKATSAEHDFEFLDGVDGRFLALKDGDLTLQVYDVERACMVQTTEAGSRMFFLPQKRAVSFANDQAELAIHREDRRPVLMKSDSVGLMISSLGEFLDWNDGFELVFCYTEKATLIEILAAGETKYLDTTGAPDFDYRVIHLPQLDEDEENASLLESAVTVRVIEDMIVVKTEERSRNLFRQLLERIQDQRSDVIRAGNASGNYKGQYAVFTDAEVNFAYLAELRQPMPLRRTRDLRIILTEYDTSSASKSAPSLGN